MGKGKEQGEILYYLDGKCYGTASTGRTICLGDEPSVKEMLANPDKRTGNKIIDGIIDLEIQLRKEAEVLR